MIADSGHRTKFSTGAVRDARPGVGRCDLMPLIEIGMILWDDVLCKIGRYIRTGEQQHLMEALHKFVPEAFGCWETALLELSIHYEEGAKKYEDRNWERGIPLHCYIDSAVRHYLKYRRGDDDERHDRAFMWNIFCAMWTQKNHSDNPELIDLPFAKKEVACESN